jgi:hypothetical protein
MNSEDPYLSQLPFYSFLNVFSCQLREVDASVGLCTPDESTTFFGKLLHWGRRPTNSNMVETSLRMTCPEY